MKRDGKRITFVDELLDPARSVNFDDIRKRDERIFELRRANLQLVHGAKTAFRHGMKQGVLLAGVLAVCVAGVWWASSR